MRFFLKLGHKNCVFPNLNHFMFKNAFSVISSLTITFAVANCLLYHFVLKTAFSKQNENKTF